MVMRLVSNTGFGSNRDLVLEVSEKVPHYVQIEALKNAFPHGKVVRNEFLLGSLHGEEGQSLRINIDPSSPNFMRGKDFSTDEGIGGITKILMSAYNWKMNDVAEYFSDYLSSGETRPEPPMNPVNPNFSAPTPPPQSPPPAAQPEQVKQRRVIDANTPHDGEHNYLSADGEILVSVRRYLERNETGEITLDADGSAKKEFRQFPRLPETRPLYNIPDIIKSDRIIWVEGEKCADALTQLGYTATCTIGGAGMLSVNTKNKFDFSPLQGKQLIIWPDNDSAGQKLAKIVQELAINAGAKSVTMLTPPSGKPKKWDAADAIEEKYDIASFINAPNNKVKQFPTLKDSSLLISEQFQGKAKAQEFLIADTIPLGVPVVFAAAGDSGKGMMTLDMAMKIASGEPMQSAFGGMISHYGNVVMLCAEDDRDELHRRIERLDPLNKRKNYKHNLYIIPMPNVGGVFPIMIKQDNTYVVSPEFERLYAEIAEIENLAFFSADPMASFVHADVNSDPAAGAAFMGLLAQISTETGATVMVNHHMAKIKDDNPIDTPEQARNSIRGTSAIVDGVRCAFALWSVDVSKAKTRCKDLSIDFSRNAVFDGAVVKSNGPANRDIRNFVRDPNTGLLVDRTKDLNQIKDTPEAQRRIEYARQVIELQEIEGMAITKASTVDGIWVTIKDSPSVEPCYIALQGLSASTVEEYVTKLLKRGKVEQHSLSTSGPRKFLGIKNGPLSSGEYIPRTGRDNV